MACLLMPMIQGCAQIDVKRITYEALRQHDCRVNEPGTFCDRGFALEYREYEQIRKAYLLDQEMEKEQTARIDLLIQESDISSIEPQENALRDTTL